MIKNGQRYISLIEVEDIDKNDDHRISPAGTTWTVTAASTCQIVDLRCLLNDADVCMTRAELEQDYLQEPTVFDSGNSHGMALRFSVFAHGGKYENNQKHYLAFAEDGACASRWEELPENAVTDLSQDAPARLGKRVSFASLNPRTQRHIIERLTARATDAETAAA